MNTIQKLTDKILDLRCYVAENTALEMTINSNTYPLQIEFYDAKIDIFQEEVAEVAPSLCFVFYDEMRIITAQGFKINETVFNKIKNLSKEINRLYLHAFREENDKVIVPMWETTFGAQVAVYNKRYYDTLMNQTGIEWE